MATRLGVAASTLRTWDRRYGLGPSTHIAGSHRKYSPDDVARLERMRQLTLQGVAPADAARAAAAFDPADPDTAPPPVQLHRRDVRERLRVDPASLVSATVLPDTRRVQRMIEQEIDDHGVVRAWAGVIGPALTALGERDTTDLPGVEPETVLLGAFLAAVRGVVGRTDLRAGPLVLLCSGEQERSLAHAVAGGLAEAGVRSEVISTDRVRDVTQVLAAAERRHARVLAILGNPFGGDELVRVASDRGDLDIFLLGDDPPPLWLPRVHRVRTLRAAVEEMAAAVPHGV